jgi:hypothetical protein
MSVDIIICVGPSDAKDIKALVNNVKQYIIGVHKIYLIMPTIVLEKYMVFDRVVENIDENIFPFNKEYIDNLFKCPERSGWYLQQLIKLYAGLVIPDILDKYLVIDSDTFFLKPTHFIENDKCLYNYGSEYHEPYFVHMLHLDRELVKVDPHKSGITHHMMFETKYVKEIIYKIAKCR